MPREAMFALHTGKISGYQIKTDSRKALTVMLVSAGYPGHYPKGLEISALDKTKDCLVFHAGTSFDDSGDKILTAGGRVIALTSLAQDIHEARQLSYKAASTIDYLGKTYRTDIGLDVAE